MRVGYLNGLTLALVVELSCGFLSLVVGFI